MLEESFSLRYHGSQYGKLAHAQGYADGFMRALIEGGIVTEREILAFVQEVRRGQAGPATRLFEGEMEGDEGVFVA